MKVFYWNEIINSKESILRKSTALSVGSFDGPHKGHFEIFKEILEFSKENGSLSGLVTFERPVSSIKQGTNYKGDISSLEERLRVFRKIGFDFVVVIHFDEDFKKIEGKEFFEILKNKLNLKCIVEGEDFCCGYKGSFSKEQIQRFCEENEIKSVFVKLVKEDGKRISSTLIRSLLAENNVDEAKKLLGID